MTDVQAPPRRLRAQDVIDQQARTIEQLTTRAPRVGDAKISFTRNAKGETQISVEVGAPMGVDHVELSHHVSEVYATAWGTYEAATRRYPTSEGTVTNDEAPEDPNKRAARAAAIARNMK